MQRRARGRRRRGGQGALLYHRRVLALEGGHAQGARSDQSHDAEEARAQGADDDDRQVRQRLEGAGGGGDARADPFPRREITCLLMRPISTSASISRRASCSATASSANWVSSARSSASSAPSSS